jgi:hypothetical protein
MEVGLYVNGNRKPFTFVSTSKDWRDKAHSFRIGVLTGFADEPKEVFVKRSRGRMVDGHMLMMGALQRPLPCSPAVLGHHIYEGDHYYFFENLPEKFHLLEDLIVKGSGVALPNILRTLLIDQDIGQRVVDVALKLFSEVHKRDFLYPDFTAKNIMVEWGGEWRCYIIDVDSCIPTSDLRERERDSHAFCMTFWSVWRDLGLGSAESLSRTMLLSFIAVWAHGAALVRAERDAGDIQVMLKHPEYDSHQKPFWDSLRDDGNLTAFQRYFGLKNQSDAIRIFARWKLAADTLVDGGDVPFEFIRDLAKHTFEIVRTAEIGEAAEPTVWRPQIPQLNEFETFILGEAAHALVGTNIEYFENKWRASYRKAGSLETLSSKRSFNWSALSGPFYSSYRRMHGRTIGWTAIMLAVNFAAAKWAGMPLLVELGALAILNSFFALSSNSSYFKRIQALAKPMLDPETAPSEINAMLAVADKRGGTRPVGGFIAGILAIAMALIPDLAYRLFG